MNTLLTDPKAWSAIAGGYDKSARRLLTPFSAEAVRWAGLDTGDDVLDVASGPGTTTILAAAEARSVHAIDFAEDMIAHLRRNTAHLANVSSAVGDGQQLGLDNDSFSVAVSMFGLMFFPDPVTGLCELHRVLRSSGRVLISSWVPMANSPMMRPLGAAMRHVLPPDPNQAAPAPFAFDTPAALEQGLAAGGFVDVEVREFAPSVPIASAESYWEDLRDNIMVNNLRQKLGSQWADTEARVVAHLRDTLAGVKSLSMPALIGRGHKP